MTLLTLLACGTVVLVGLAGGDLVVRAIRRLKARREAAWKAEVLAAAERQQAFEDLEERAASKMAKLKWGTNETVPRP